MTASGRFGAVGCAMVTPFTDDGGHVHQGYAHFVRSPYAHARIRGVDVARAKAAPGVLAVLTGADWERAGR